MQLIVRKRASVPVWSQRVEIVERKGIGHPDTICDGVAEHICVQLCRHYLDRFGIILHHNVDKILLCGGSARVSFGGGEMLQPIEIYIGGRATYEYRGERIPVHEIAEEACRNWLETRLPTLDIDQDVQIVTRIRPGSSDLVGLFDRTASPAANDTSCGAGFAPRSDLEKVVLEVERTLNSFKIKQSHPGIGVDIKVLGARVDDYIELTISCALVGRFVRDIDDYVRQKNVITKIASEAAHRVTPLSTSITVNAADDLEAGNVFLTVTGTSAEAGDDGEVGRGNRTCGLITPYRVMTVEAAAGKNPIIHVGKLYNLLAGRIAETIVENLQGVVDAECVLLSRIGRPVNDPQIADICLAQRDAELNDAQIKQVSNIVHSELERIDEVRDALLAERLRLY